MGAPSLVSGRAGSPTCKQASRQAALAVSVGSGFGDALSAGSGRTSRVSNAPPSDMELLVEDGGPGATPNGSVATGANTSDSTFDRAGESRTGPKVLRGHGLRRWVWSGLERCVVEWPRRRGPSDSGDFVLRR
jgi:hypothetical protein